MINKQISSTALAFSGMVIFYFIFYPAINILFYAGDDFKYAFGGWHQLCRADDGFEFVLTLGRPLQGYMDCIVFKYAHTLERLSFIRLFSVVVMGCCLGLFANGLVKLGFSILSAFFFAGSVFLVQHFYWDGIFTGAISLPITTLLVLLAYRSIEQAHFYLVDGKRTQATIKLTLAGVLILSSMLTYPALAFFFCILTFSKLLFSDLNHWTQTRQEVIREVILFCLAGLVYYLWANYNIHYHALAPVTESQYALNHPNISFHELLHRVFILGNVFHPLWALTPISDTRLQGWGMLALIGGGSLTGLIHYFVKSSDAIQASFTLLQAIFLGVFLLLLCNGFLLVMPHLILNENRILFCVVASGLVLTFWGIKNSSLFFSKLSYQRIIVMMNGLIFMIIVYQVSINVIAEALSDKQYLLFTQSIIGEYLKKHPLQRIHFIVSQSDYPYNKFFLSNAALNQLLGRGHYKIEWCSLPRGVPGKEEDHQADTLSCMAKQPLGTIVITYSYPQEQFTKTKDMLTVDMTSISAANFRIENLRKYFYVT